MNETEPRATLVPLTSTSRDLQQSLPIRITADTSIENVEGLLKEKDFDLWEEYLARHDRQELAATRIALVNRYQGVGHFGTSEVDNASQQTVYKLFILLRLVKPTKTRFVAVHVKNLGTEEADIFRLTTPNPRQLNLPASEKPNTLTAEDLRRASQMSQRFLSVLDHGPESFRRAVRFYEEGYSNIWDPVLQFITWVIGIESACSTGEQIVARDELIDRIAGLVPFNEDVYGQSVFKEGSLRDHFRIPEFRVADAVRDLFYLRDHLVHGLWVPKEWDEKEPKYHIPGAPAALYADALRDAAAYILRRIVVRLTDDR